MINTTEKYSTVVEHKYGKTSISLIEYPGPEDWMAVYRRALITMNKHPTKSPSDKWIEKILRARHSPIRRAMYSFEFQDIPSNISTHFARHKHAEPYVGSLRTDRITPEYLTRLRDDLNELIDSDHAPRITPVCMILDVNAEEIQVMANKRLCMQASEITRQMMHGMARLVVEVTPQMENMLVPLCQYCGGICHEMNPCGRCIQG